MFILGWVAAGLVIGALAKLVMPGRDPGGVVVTMLLGISGALLAGWVGQGLGWYREGEPAGYVASIAGAVAILAVYRVLLGTRALGPAT